MSDRRVVLYQLNGIRRIVGVLSGDVAPAHLPSALTGMIGGDVASGLANLGKVDGRYVIYRECVAATEEDGA